MINGTTTKTWLVLNLREQWVLLVELQLEETMMILNVNKTSGLMNSERQMHALRNSKKN
jgi:adenylosuccinate lyase